MRNLLLFILLLSTFSGADAQYTKLLDFAGVENGNGPCGNLISEGDVLYGVTQSGGTTNSGVIFKIKPNGTEYASLFNLDSASGGGVHGSLISDGTFLYGMTSRNVFKIKLDGTGYFKLLDFTGINGLDAIGSLIYDGTFLYGMTWHGGINSCDQYGQGCGVIFKIKPDGTGYSKLLDFGSSGGVRPYGSLISDGTWLYGMTRYGGSNSACTCPYGCGVVFKIRTDGTEYTDLYNFDGSKGQASGSLFSDGIFLYGMTAGNIFKIKPDGTEYAGLFDFGGADGSEANGSLISDGTFLYGMTREGGINANGVLFKIKPDGTEFTKLLDFTGINGRDPMGALISEGTHIYGMTRMGGVNDMGVVFSFNESFTGISPTEEAPGITVFPNPSNGIFTLTLNNTTANIKISIYDILGNCLLNKDYRNTTSPQFDLSSQGKGVYFVEIASGNEREVKKIVIQ